MSPPCKANLLGIDLTIEDETERLAATLSALRRRDRDEALAELDRWQSIYYACDSRADDEHGLTEWVRDESRLHVQAGRFEYAIALIERYRQQPVSDFKEPAQ